MTGLLSPSHVLLLLVVALVLFGAKRLPELGRSLGSGLREFKTSIGAEPGDERVTHLPAPAPAPAAGTIAPPASASQPGPEPAVDAPPPAPAA
jgi:sec-independent protein translocase protein TatA